MADADLRETLAEVKAALRRARRIPRRGSDELGYDEAVNLALDIIDRDELSAYLRNRVRVKGVGDGT